MLTLHDCLSSPRQILQGRPKSNWDEAYHDSWNRNRHESIVLPIFGHIIPELILF